MILALVTALQLQCGIQQAGDQSLSYGTVIYVTAENSAPQLAYFELTGNDFTSHPYCEFIQDKMNSNSSFTIKLEKSAKKILGLK
ncbi:hypothetical protein [Bdellovibrio bacteriovorus]|uniref:Uncharacterized protein n=1 Tax=Bdellovibrio bacteriovorus str. Tiberius TaxID=1069642 RepID=K7YQG8_BDEBC|nr:hypothetical protein [Bdellovibrio bacteriovorus]AFY02106.1 Hypothetical protein Bdt_2423 [Bdellovibrio bacteriovorus str. Tiberius]